MTLSVRVAVITMSAAFLTTSLLYAAPIHDAANGADLAALTRLLDAGADIDARNELGGTALHIAALYGHVDIAQLLVARGAEVDARDDEGITPLNLAARTGETEVARELIAAGADVDARGMGQATPLGMAAMGDHSEVAELLIRNHADVNARFEGGGHAFACGRNQWRSQGCRNSDFKRCRRECENAERADAAALGNRQASEAHAAISEGTGRN